MTVERFTALADAYGGDLRRWPAVDRDAARAFQARQGAIARRVLDEAIELDRRLYAASVPAPTSLLRELILAGAPRAPRGFGLVATVSWLRWPAWLAPGVGVAAACCAGAILGLTVSRHAETQLTADTVLVASADLAAADPESSGIR
jgi:hypothetical protein